MGLGDVDGEEVFFDGIRAFFGEAVVVVIRSEGVGVAGEGEFFVGVGEEEGGDDIELALGAGGEGFFVEAEVEDEGVSSGGVFDEGGEVDVSAGDAGGVVCEELVEIYFGDAPGLGFIGPLDDEAELGCALSGFILDVSFEAGGGLAVEHGAEGFFVAEAVFGFFEDDAESGDLGVGDFFGIDEGFGVVEILFEGGGEEGVGDAEGVYEDDP